MDDSQKDLTKAAWSVGSHNESRAESRHSQSSARPRSSFRHRHPFLPLPPRTFYAACQSCGRTFLGLLTAWPAALLPAFAAFLLLTSGNASAQDSVESDRAVLVALYNATDGPNWTDNTHWLSNEPLSEWRGGGVNDDGRVTELDLRNNRLTGEIPVELFQLSQLEWLHLAYNQLTGPIPPELGQLSHVQELYLYVNQLTGTIPVELSQLFRLQLLTLDNNQLTDGSNLAYLYHPGGTVPTLPAAKVAPPAQPTDGTDTNRVGFTVQSGAVQLPGQPVDGTVTNPVEPSARCVRVEHGRKHGGPGPDEGDLGRPGRPHR